MGQARAIVAVRARGFVAVAVTVAVLGAASAGLATRAGASVHALQSTTVVLDTGSVGIVGVAMPLKATVSCPGFTATGSVNFLRSGNPTPIGTVAVDGTGVATFDASGVLNAYGDYTITAEYEGDANCAGSTSSEEDLTVFPSDPVNRYVDFVYEILLGRAVDHAGLVYWRGLLVGGVDRGAIAWALVNSVEYRSAVIDRTFQHYLGRPADAGGRSFFLGQTAVGLSFINIDLLLVASNEYYSDAGGTHDGFIDAMFTDLLGRSPDSGGRSYFESLLNQGVSRIAITGGVLYGNEHLAGVVNGLYAGILGRTVDSDGKKYWVGRVQTGMPIQVLIALLVGSDELYSDITGFSVNGAGHAPAGGAPTVSPYLAPTNAGALVGTPT